jgi:hypothetical protein
MTGLQGYNKCAGCGRFIRITANNRYGIFDIGCNHCEDWLA